MQVFVTGAGGFIGSHLVEALVDRGYDVRAMVHYNALGREGWLEHINAQTRQKIEVVAGDIRDLTFVRRAVAGCEGVFHLAALIGIPYSYINPESYIDTNVKGTMNVLEAARDLGIKKLIHTSTSEVYGTARFVPITEEHPLQGQSPYSASKIGADQMAFSYHRSFQTPVVTVRPFNTFGERQSMRAVIPTIIAQLLEGERVRIGALSPTRDFSHVSDTVSGFVTVFESTNESLQGQVINLGSGFEISIADTIFAIAKIMGKTPEIICEAERIRPQGSEVERLFADNSKAYDWVGWKPQYAGKEGFVRSLERVIAWYAKPENRRHFDIRSYKV